MDNRGRGSLLTIGGFGDEMIQKVKPPLSDITNVSVPETPRTNGVLDEGDIALEEVPTAPMKSEVKAPKSLKTTSGKRLHFEDENSLQHIRRNAVSDPKSPTAAKHTISHQTENEVVLAPPPMLKKHDNKIRKRYNITGRKDMEDKTPQKKKVPLLYGSNVTVDSPDPMSKYNASNSSNISAMSKVSTTLSKIMGDFEVGPQVHPSPDSIMDDIYDFSPSSASATTKASSSSSRWKGESISEVLRNCAPDSLPGADTARTLHPPRNGGTSSSTDEDDGLLFEKTMEDNIATLRRQKARKDRRDPLAQNASSRTGTRMVRTGAGRLLKPASLEQLSASSSTSSIRSSEPNLKLGRPPSGHPRETTPVRKQLPTSRSLDTLGSPLLSHIQEEAEIGSPHNSPILTDPTPRPPMGGLRGSAPARKNVRLQPSPPSSQSPAGPSPTASGSLEVISVAGRDSGSNSGSFNGRNRGRTYRPSPVNMTAEVCSFEFEPVGCKELANDFSQENVEPTASTVSVTEGTATEESLCKEDGDRGPSCVSPVYVAVAMQGRKKDPNAGRTITVSGCSRNMMMQLLSKASRRRKKRSKHPLFFSPRFEPIPEEETIEFSIPRWLSLTTEMAYRSVLNAVPSSNRPTLEKRVCIPPESSTASEENSEMASEYVEWLMSQGSEAIEDKSNVELTAFFAAIRRHDGSVFKDMLANNDKLVYGRDYNGNTALIISTIVGWRKGIKLLIKRGADVNAQNRFGNTCLHFAHALGGGGDIQRYFMKKSASDKIRNERGLCCVMATSEVMACSDIAMI